MRGSMVWVAAALAAGAAAPTAPYPSAGMGPSSPPNPGKIFREPREPKPATGADLERLLRAEERRELRAQKRKAVSSK